MLSFGNITEGNMSDNKTRLLEETLSLFNMMGVREGVGMDGKLMTKIIAELSGSTSFAPVIEVPRGRCPCCGAPDLTMCDCDPMEQLAASQK